MVKSHTDPGELAEVLLSDLRAAGFVAHVRLLSTIGETPEPVALFIGNDGAGIALCHQDESGWTVSWVQKAELLPSGSRGWELVRILSTNFVIVPSKHVTRRFIPVYGLPA